MAAPLTILYFAWVREQIGHDEENLALPDHIGDMAGLLEYLAARSPRHAAALHDRSRLRFALNQNFVKLEARVQAGDEVAIFPPVTGG